MIGRPPQKNLTGRAEANFRTKIRALEAKVAQNAARLHLWQRMVP